MTTAAANSTTGGTLPANLLLRVLGDSIVTISRAGAAIATQSTARDNFVGPYPDETAYSVVAGGGAVDIALVNSERALVVDTEVPVMSKTVNGATVLVGADGLVIARAGATSFNANDTGSAWEYCPPILSFSASLTAGTSTTVLLEVKDAAGTITTAATIVADIVAQVIRSDFVTRDSNQFRFRRSSGTGTVAIGL